MSVRRLPRVLLLALGVVPAASGAEFSRLLGRRLMAPSGLAPRRGTPGLAGAVAGSVG